MPVIRGSGRRPRLSDVETERRMLQAGARFVVEQGLSLSLEHLSIEELIHAAGVSRTSSYRRWPTKDLFTADLLLLLASATELSGEIAGLSAALASLEDDLLASVDTEQGRRDAVVAILRVVLEADFLAVLDSTEWRQYIALRAAHVGLPDDDLRERVAGELRDTERRFTLARATALQALTGLIGYRLRSPEPAAWHRLSLTLGALSTGMLIRGYSDPDAVRSTSTLTPFGSSVPAQWSVATLATVGILLDSLEPDPAVVWDEARIAELRARMADIEGTVRHVQGRPDHG